MRFLKFILLLLISVSSFSQNIKINGSGIPVKINGTGQPVTINKTAPSFESATYPIEYKSVSGDQATAIVITKGDGIVYYDYLDESDVVIFSGDISMDTGPPIGTIKTSVFTSLSLSDLATLTFTNATVANYVAFGNIIHRGDQDYAWSGRRGGNHLGGGRICTQPYNSLTRTFGTRTIISRAGTEDLRGGSHCVVGSQILFFTSLYDPGLDVFTHLLLHTSTDLTGAAWDEDTLLYKTGTNGGVDETTYARFNFHGKPFNKPGTDTWLVGWYEHNGAGTWKQNYIKTTDNFATWSTHTIFNGTTPKVGEHVFAYLGGDSILSVGRQIANAPLMQSLSTDFGATWSAWQETNLGSSLGQGIPAINYSPEYGIMLLYADRPTGNMMLTLNNSVADILANPTGYSTPFILYTVAAGDDYQPLGYGDIERVAQYRFMISFSEELEGGATTKLHIGDGHLNALIP